MTNDTGGTGAQAERCRRFMDMTDAAVELVGRTIDEAEHDPKLLRHITGALKDLKELIDEPPGAADTAENGGIVIRIEDAGANVTKSVGLDSSGGADNAGGGTAGEGAERKCM